MMTFEVRSGGNKVYKFATLNEAILHFKTINKSSYNCIVIRYAPLKSDTLFTRADFHHSELSYDWFYINKNVVGNAKSFEKFHNARTPKDLLD